MVWSALAAGGLNIAGGLMGNSSSRSQQRRAQEFAFQMATNAHQYQVADMRKAGLNPRLSAMGGGGAATPSVGIASQNNPLSDGVNSALAAKRLQEEIVNIRETNNNLKAQSYASTQLGRLYSAQQVGQGQQNRILAVDANVNEKLGVGAGVAISGARALGSGLSSAVKAGWKFNPVGAAARYFSKKK